MPLGTLAQPAGISTPATNAQLPFPLFVNGNELSQGPAGADALTYSLRDPGFTGPQLFSFTIHDHTNAVVGWIAKQQPVLWFDATKARPLFWGYIKDISLQTRAAWVDISVTCADRSEGLDYGRPIVAVDAGLRHTDAAAIGVLVGTYSHDVSGAGGFIQTLDASLPASVPITRSTLRNGIDQVLAATGATGAVAYVDAFGYLHTMAAGDVAAPYAISDAPNYTTSVPADLNIRDQGAEDVDGLYVYGATPAATGPVYAWQVGITTPPRSPFRWATLDAPQAVDANGALAAAQVEFLRRQVAVVVTVTVSPDAAHGNFDGWAKGQLLTVTNAVLGYSAKQFTISAVDMAVINGKGQRRYTITAGTDPVLFTRRLHRTRARLGHVPLPTSSFVGAIGNRNSLTGAG